MAHKVNNKGFGIIQTLAIVVAVLIIGTAGLLVYQHNKTKPADAAIKSQQSTKQKASTKQPSPTIGYLNIKEWGVKLPLSAQIKDAYYVVATNSPETMWLGLRSLNKGDCNALQANTTVSKLTAIGALVRVNPKQIDPASAVGSTYEQDFPGTTIGNYYYAYMGGVEDKTCASHSVLQSVDSALAAAAKDIIPIGTKAKQ